MSVYVGLTINCDGEESPAGQGEGEILSDDTGEVITPGHVWWVDMGQINITPARRALKQRGWTRPLVGDRYLDLCPACTLRFNQWKEDNQP